MEKLNFLRAGLLIANSNYNSAKSDAAAKDNLDTLVFIGSGKYI